MKPLSKGRAYIALAVIPWIALPSCKKRGEAVKSDLSQAGYKLTAEDWFLASQRNDIAALKKFHSAKFPIDTRNAAGDSALHAAAAAGAQGSADFLLDQKLPIDLPGANKRTPLMAAVIGDQKDMVQWLIKQGANPRLKDQDDFSPLMLAVKESRPHAVAELAAHDRENLDAALLLAALVGRAEVIDSLTNYGASIYAKMEDGRTPLMIAAENGHTDAVKLLLDLGANRLAVDSEGKTAADLATAAEHPEIVALINREPSADELALDSPEEIAAAMDERVDAAIAKSNNSLSNKSENNKPATPRARSTSIEGAVITKTTVQTANTTPTPALIMRHYREKEVPIRIKSVQGDTATLQIASATTREAKVRSGEKIPGSNLTVVRVQRRMGNSKVNPDSLAEISTIEVRDDSTGATREWVAGVSSSSHDPIALVEDTATGKRYTASPGQKFRSADGNEYLISDVRPNQIIVQETATGTVQTIPLRGPRG